MALPAQLKARMYPLRRVAVLVVYERGKRVEPPRAGTVLMLELPTLHGFLQGVATRGLIEGVRILSRTRSIEYEAPIDAPDGWRRHLVAGGPLPIDQREQLRIGVTCDGRAWPEVMVEFEPVDPRHTEELEP